MKTYMCTPSCTEHPQGGYLHVVPDAPAEPRQVLRYAPEHRRQYKLPDGSKAPGVTTILGMLDKPALTGWACRCGEEAMRDRIAEYAECGGVSRDFVISLQPIGDAHKVRREHAADIGTCAHHRCEAHVRGMDGDEDAFPSDIWHDATKPTEAFVRWWDEEAGLTLVCAEQALVEPFILFGGTIDLIARDELGNLHLVDLKTSRHAGKYGWRGTSIYPEAVVQTAAYMHLWDQAHPDEPIRRAVVARIGKERGDTIDVVDITGAFGVAWDFFHALVRAYYCRRTFENEDK
jgi:Holliday junction resolvase-like predicted endonuclease